jgi:hypothetical protein
MTMVVPVCGSLREWCGALAIFLGNVEGIKALLAGEAAILQIT